MTTVEATLDATTLAPAHPEHVPHDKLVIMAWSGDLDKVWPTFILGTTGAAMGMETTIFFTFGGCSRSCATRCISPVRTGCRR
jgi:hypothetical protein